VNRRSFLKIAFAVGVASALPISLTKDLEDSWPIVYGDGVHDDTAGLQAALRGENFIARNECVQVTEGCCFIHDGSFLISRTIDLGSSRISSTKVFGCLLTAAEGFVGEAMFRADPGFIFKDLHFESCVFQGYYIGDSHDRHLRGPPPRGLKT
jgi:hypothetical protein